MTSFWPTDKNNSEKPVHRIEFYPNCVYYFFLEFRVDKPYKVDNCLLNYEYIEVIHAGIQLLLVIFAYCFGVPLAHYLVTVVEPKYRQNLKKQPLSNGHAMYSIEYNQVNETTGGNTQETDFYRYVINYLNLLLP